MLITQLKKNIEHSMLCAGIDPDLTKIPKFKKYKNLRFYLINYVNATINHVCAYKIQKAFFDNIKAGQKELKFIINYIHKKNKNLPVLLDCKIGDIENTMRAYLENIFNNLKADGVLINPYMGHDVLMFAEEFPEKFFVVLVKTSNKGADIIQNLELKNAHLLWEQVLEITRRYNKNKNIIYVLSRLNTKKNWTNFLNENEMVLFAGTGTQNADMMEIKHILNSKKNNVFFNVSRRLMYNKFTNPKDFFKEVENIAKMYKDLSYKIKEE